MAPTFHKSGCRWRKQYALDPNYFNHRETAVACLGLKDIFDVNLMFIETCIFVITEE